jgi:hypothetical protein
MRANMRIRQSNVKATVVTKRKWTGKDQGTEMTLDLFAATAAAILFIGPFVALAIAALAFGVDSRPTIDDRGPRRWMVGG